MPGISGGYVGIGDNEYGNFSNPTEGRYLGPGAYPNTVTIRGSVVGFGGGAIGDTINASSYPWIATSANNGSLWYNGATRPDQTSANYRRVTIQITPAPNPVANVWIQFGYNTSAVQMITNRALARDLNVAVIDDGLCCKYRRIHQLSRNSQSAGNQREYDHFNQPRHRQILPRHDDQFDDGHSCGGWHPLYRYRPQLQLPNNVTATGVGIVDNIPAAITGVS